MTPGRDKIGEAGWRREYRCDPSTLRLYAYIATGYPLCFIIWLAVVSHYSGVYGPGQPNVQTMIVIGVYCFLPSPFLYIFVSGYRWRLIVDDRGITERKLFRTMFWPWELFELGQVRRTHALGYYRPDLPKRRRRLGLDWMTSPNELEVMETIDLFWNPPKPQQSPVVFQAEIRGRTIDTKGVGIRRWGEVHREPWSEVKKVEIVSWFHKWQDFERLRFTTAREEFTICNDRMNRKDKYWSGSEPEVLRAGIEASVEPDKIKYLALYGAVLSEDDKNERIAEIERRIVDNVEAYRNTMRILFKWAVTPYVVVTAILALLFVGWQMVLVTGPFGILLVLAGVLTVYDKRSKERDLQDHLAAARSAPIRPPNP